MKNNHNALALLLMATFTTALAGCALNQDSAALTSQHTHIEKEACCTDVSQFSWIPLEGKALDIRIDENSPVAIFEGSKSYFAAFSVPDNVNRMTLKISSWMRAEGVFAPRVLLIDDQFKFVKMYTLDDFNIEAADMFHLSSYQMAFEVDREQTPYIVVYSPMTYRTGSVTLEHPERARARRLGMAQPMVIDPVIQHSNSGWLELEIRNKELRGYRVNEQLPTQKDRVFAGHIAETGNVQNVIETTASSNTATRSTVVKNADFYDQQILNSVRAGRLEEAMKWVNEAKNAGYMSAEKTFVDLITVKQQ